MSPPEEAAVVAPPVRRRDQCPNVGELRALLGRALGSARATQGHLAELLGVSKGTVRRWERGARPGPAFRPRLVDLERRLQSRKASIDEELSGRQEAVIGLAAPGSALAQSGFASEFSLRVEGDLARFVFVVKLPGEGERRVVADVLVPRGALASSLGMTRV